MSAPDAALVRHLIEHATNMAELDALEPSLEELGTNSVAERARAAFTRQRALLAVGAGPKPRRKMPAQEGKRIALRIQRASSMLALDAIARVLHARYPDDPLALSLEEQCARRRDALARISVGGAGPPPLRAPRDAR